jgi:RimJ/RimL family protein N-acetyltransferase
MSASESETMSANPLAYDLNALGQKIGLEVQGWAPVKRPSRITLAGRFCRVEPLDVGAHAADLHEANCLEPTGRNWTYLPYGPFPDLASYRAWVETVVTHDDPLFYAIIDLATNKAVGVATLMRIDPANGVIETGHLSYSPHLQRHPAATEAMFLLMRYIFDDLGNRRYEWKCHALNEPSNAAALRLGFTYEGCFRQAVVTRGRNRDTNWYSIIDREWPTLKIAYENWLSPANFDANGQQRQSLRHFFTAHR